MPWKFLWIIFVGGSQNITRFFIWSSPCYENHDVSVESKRSTSIIDYRLLINSNIISLLCAKVTLRLQELPMDFYFKVKLSLVVLWTTLCKNSEKCK